MTSGNAFIATILADLVPDGASQLPALIALLVGIVLVAVNWSKDRRRAAMGVGAFALALLCTVAWPVVIPAVAWFGFHHVVTERVLDDAFELAVRALTGLAWLLIVVALFPGKAPARAPGG